jgi:hypothetical protein
MVTKRRWRGSLVYLMQRCNFVISPGAWHRSATRAPRCRMGRARQRAAPSRAIQRLQISVARRQHRGKPRCLLLAPPLLARLLEMAVTAHRLQCAFAVDLLLQSPQRFLDWLAFFKLNFGQNSLTSSPGTSGHSGPSWPVFPFGQAAKHIEPPGLVNRQLRWKPACLPPLA